MNGGHCGAELRHAPALGHATLPTPAMSPRPAMRPATEISSSSASQCMPIGLRITAARRVDVVCDRRGNHASGTPRVRPSDRATHMLSSSKLTCLGDMGMVGSFNLTTLFRERSKPIMAENGRHGPWLRGILGCDNGGVSGERRRNHSVGTACLSLGL